MKANGFDAIGFLKGCKYKNGGTKEKYHNKQIDDTIELLRCGERFKDMWGEAAFDHLTIEEFYNIKRKYFPELCPEKAKHFHKEVYMKTDKDKNYLKLKKMIEKAQKEFTHYIHGDNSTTFGKMCSFQGYCEAYFDLELITEEQFYKLDKMI